MVIYAVRHVTQVLHRYTLIRRTTPPGAMATSQAIVGLTLSEADDSPQRYVRIPNQITDQIIQLASELGTAHSALTVDFLPQPSYLILIPYDGPRIHWAGAFSLRVSRSSSRASSFAQRHLGLLAVIELDLCLA